MVFILGQMASAMQAGGQMENKKVTEYLSKTVELSSTGCGKMVKNKTGLMIKRLTESGRNMRKWKTQNLKRRKETS